jgi:Putative addiction module component
MSDAVARVLAHVDGLSQEERAELAYAVLCSLEPEEDSVAVAWDEELSHRVAEIRSGKAVGRLAEPHNEER